MLTHGSDKRVWRICEVCSKEDDIVYNDYNRGRKICGSCAHKNRTKVKRGPFNIEYFQFIQKSIDSGGVNEFRTFNEFKYYSIDLLSSSNRHIYRICEGCGKESSIKYCNYVLGHISCNSCTQTGKIVSEETKKKISENHADNSGENSPMYGKHLSEETKKKISENRPDSSGENNPMYGKRHSEETRRRSSATMQGITYDEWVGFSSENLYAKDFNKTIKMYIRVKYGNRCFLCNKTSAENSNRELSVHHIDRNKQNTSEQNLIPLCGKCHPPSHTKLMIARLQYIQREANK